MSGLGRRIGRRCRAGGSSCEVILPCPLRLVSVFPLLWYWVIGNTLYDTGAFVGIQHMSWGQP